MKKRENIIRAITRDNPEWIPYRYDGSLSILKPKAIVVRPEQGGLDDWGTNWVATNQREGSYPDGRPVIAADRIEELRPPRTDFELVTRTLKEQIAGLIDADTLVIGCSELTLFERAGLLLGTDTFLMMTALDPERMEKVVSVIADHQAQLTESLLNAGVSGVRFTDDWGTQASMFISPQQWRRLIKPALKRLYHIVKSRDGFVFQHSCGHIEEIVPDLIEIGVDVLDPCQPQANDIYEWKKQYGNRLCFMGGLDTQSYLSFGDPAKVKEHVMETASILGKGGGYIAAPSHSITIPSENLKAMLDALYRVNSSRDFKIANKCKND